MPTATTAAASTRQQPDDGHPHPGQQHRQHQEARQRGQHAAEVAAQTRRTDDAHGDERQHQHGASGRQAGAVGPGASSGEDRQQRGDAQRTHRHQPEGEVAVAGEPSRDDRVVAEQAVELERRPGQHVGEEGGHGDGKNGERRPSRYRRQGPSSAIAVTTTSAPSTAATSTGTGAPERSQGTSPAR